MVDARRSGQKKRSEHAYHSNNRLVFGHNPCTIRNFSAQTPNLVKLVVPLAPSDF